MGEGLDRPTSNLRPAKLPRRSRAGIVLIGGLCALVSLSLITGIAIYLRSPAPVSVVHEAVVDLGVPMAEIQTGQAIRFTAPPGAAFEMIDGGGSNHTGGGALDGWLVHTRGALVALAANSSHLGCAVAFDAGNRWFLDPCGGSLFALDGSVLHGPARFPLAHLAWRRVGPATIAVRTVERG